MSLQSGTLDVPLRRKNFTRGPGKRQRDGAEESVLGTHRWSARHTEEQFRGAGTQDRQHELFKGTGGSPSSHTRETRRHCTRSAGLHSSSGGRQLGQHCSLLNVACSPNSQDLDFSRHFRILSSPQTPLRGLMSMPVMLGMHDGQHVASSNFGNPLGRQVGRVFKLRQSPQDLGRGGIQEIQQSEVTCGATPTAHFGGLVWAHARSLLGVQDPKLLRSKAEAVKQMLARRT
jgi:hypothetical protein